MLILFLIEYYFEMMTIQPAVNGTGNCNLEPNKNDRIKAMYVSKLNIKKNLWPNIS